MHTRPLLHLAGPAPMHLGLTLILAALLPGAHRVHGAWSSVRSKSIEKPLDDSIMDRKHVSQGQGGGHGDDPSKDHITVPQPTLSGFLPVNPELGSDMFYVYYERRENLDNVGVDTTPIIMWLQGGPGCSSLFGMLYIQGPYFINTDMTLRRNLASWNRLYGIMFIEQPIGVGWSRAGRQKLPTHEIEVAADLYKATQNFYRANEAFMNRPLIIAGESYAGKYAPSFAHYVLQADAIVNDYLHKLNHPRKIDRDSLEAPLFKLGGLAVGNGFTDAETQTLAQAELAWGMGLIDSVQRRVAEAMQQVVVDLVRNKSLRAARVASDALNRYITNCSGSAILEDIRRNTGYDGQNTTDLFLNQAHVAKALGAPQDVYWVSCSPELDDALSGDVMRSVKLLVEDLLIFHPSLFYQGQFDAECGVASNDAWISKMAWKGYSGFSAAERTKWMVNGRVAGYWKEYDTLTVAVVRNTGHMVPHDNPLIGQMMIERWIEENVRMQKYEREVTPELERKYSNPDQGQEANEPSWGSE